MGTVRLLYALDTIRRRAGTRARTRANKAFAVCAVLRRLAKDKKQHRLMLNIVGGKRATVVEQTVG